MVPIRPLTDREIELIASLEPLISTPREAKRLLNLYRMIRATRNLSPASQFLGDEDRAGDYQAVVVLLGLLTAHARLLGQVLDSPANAKEQVRGGLKHRVESEQWKHFVAGLAPREVGGVWRNDVLGTVPASDIGPWATLSRGMKPSAALVNLADLSTLQTWEPRIRRFSFVLSPLGPASEPLATDGGAGLRQRVGAGQPAPG